MSVEGNEAAEVVTESAEQDEFSSGFSGTGITPTETPEPEPVAVETATEQKSTETPAEPEPPAVEYAQITKAEYERLMAVAASIDTIKASQDKAFGKIGGVERVLQQLQASTPAGQPVEITDEDLQDIYKDFPEFRSETLRMLKTVAPKLRGTGTALDPTQVESLVQPKLVDLETRLERKVETRLLAKEHKDWSAVVGSTEFRTWLTSQPAEFQQKLNNSWEADFVSEALTTFKTSEKARLDAAAAVKKPTPKPADTTRQKRIEAAVPVKGVGGHAPVPSEDDAFNAGFNSR